MEAVFLKLLNMSITGCVMIMAVLIARLLLKKSAQMEHLSAVGTGSLAADLPLYT